MRNVEPERSEKQGQPQLQSKFEASLNYLRPCLKMEWKMAQSLSRFESCWPALMKDAHGVVIVFNADIPSHLKEIEMWYSCFVQQQFLQDSHCMLVAHHKPGSGGDKGSLALSPPLNKLKLVHSNLEEDPEEVRAEFIKYLKSIINSMSESRDREEMLIIT